MERRKIKYMLPYLAAIAFTYYILPHLFDDLSGNVINLMVLSPLICFISGILYGKNKTFNLIFASLAGVLFLPAVFLYYNSTAIFYCILYAFVSLVGNLVGLLFKPPNTAI